MPIFDDVLEAARTLTPTERLRLVDALWQDVSIGEWPLPSAEWMAEVRQRSSDFEQGRTSAKPWNEVRILARQKAGLDE